MTFITSIVENLSDFSWRPNPELWQFFACNYIHKARKGKKDHFICILIHPYYHVSLYSHINDNVTGKLSIETQQHPHFQKSIALNGGQHISRLGNTPAAHCNNNTIQLWYSPVLLSRQCYSQLSHFYTEPWQKPNANNCLSHPHNRSLHYHHHTWPHTGLTSSYAQEFSAL